MKKIVILFLFLGFTIFGYSQNYTNFIQKLKSDYSYFSESVLCLNSNALAKAEYYIYDDTGYVIIYFKETDYDIIGKPYLFCNISNQRWNNFRTEGIISWGKSYNKYIRDFTCEVKARNNGNNTGYKIQQPMSSFNAELADDVLSTLQKRYDNTNRNYINNNTNYTSKEVNIAKYNLNYKYALGIGYSGNIYEIILVLKVGNKTSIQTQYSKFIKTKELGYQEEYFNKQFGISSIFNYNASFFSKNLFFVTGVGISYSKSKVEWKNEFENEINPILNLGLDYNFEKIPISIGVYNKLDFGDYANIGFCFKFINNKF